MQAYANHSAFITLGMFVTKCIHSHVVHANGALAAAVYKGITIDGMKLGSRDDLYEILHVCRLDIHNV